MKQTIVKAFYIAVLLMLVSALGLAIYGCAIVIDKESTSDAEAFLLCVLTVTCVYLAYNRVRSFPKLFNFA